VDYLTHLDVAVLDVEEKPLLLEMGLGSGVKKTDLE